MKDFYNNKVIPIDLLSTQVGIEFAKRFATGRLRICKTSLTYVKLAELVEASILR